MNSDLSNVTVSVDSGYEEILEALGRIAGPQIGSGFVMVVDQDGILSGIITDADFRRTLLRHKEADFVAADAMNKQFVSMKITEGSDAEFEELVGAVGNMQWKTFNPIRAIPIVDQAGRPYSLLEVTGREQSLLRNRDGVIVIGQGFVGSTLAAVLAGAGVRTIGLDSNPAVIEQLRRGVSVTKEEGLEPALQDGMESGKLEFVCSLEEIPAFEKGMRQYFIVTVGTPVVSGVPDVRAVFEVVESIAGRMKRGDSIVLRSTVPIGTSKKISALVEAQTGWRVGVDFYVSSAPERTVEGQAIKELSSLPQIIGGVTTRCAHVARALFEQFAPSVIEVPTSEFAELVKLSSNAYRDYSFAFSNFLADISSRYNIDVNKLIEVANLGYPRNQIAQPSPGVGGPCLTKDSYMLPGTDLEGLLDNSPVLIARKYNEFFVNLQASRLDLKLKELGISSVVAIGIAFKGEPETNDLRGSTAIEICRELQKFGIEVDSWDAVVGEGAGGFGEFVAGKTYEAILILNNHKSNIAMALNLMASETVRLVFDPWRLLQRKQRSLEDSGLVRGAVYMSLSNYYE